MARSVVGLPPPPKSLDATLVTWGGGLEFHRVHGLAFGGDEFKTSTKGNARFSPITDDAGVLIPTLYAGTTFDCALMETIFHDVPFKSGFKPFSKLKMDGKVHSVVLPTADLRLIDLSTIALHKLGVKRTELIDTTKPTTPLRAGGCRQSTSSSPMPKGYAGPPGRMTKRTQSCSSTLA